MPQPQPSVEEQSNNMQLGKYCPLIKTRCRKDCTCFRNAYMHTPKDYLDPIKKPTLIEATCISPLIDGVVQVEQV